LAGYVERGTEVYYFAANIETSVANESFGPARIEISKAILRD
jgi:beta-lactamase class D